MVLTAFPRTSIKEDEEVERPRIKGMVPFPATSEARSKGLTPFPKATTIEAEAKEEKPGILSSILEKVKGIPGEIAKSEPVKVIKQTISNIKSPLETIKETAPAKVAGNIGQALKGEVMRRRSFEEYEKSLPSEKDIDKYGDYTQTKEYFKDLDPVQKVAHMAAYPLMAAGLGYEAVQAAKALPQMVKIATYKPTPLPKLTPEEIGAIREHFSFGTTLPESLKEFSPKDLAKMMRTGARTAGGLENIPTPPKKPLALPEKVAPTPIAEIPPKAVPGAELTPIPAKPGAITPKIPPIDVSVVEKVQKQISPVRQGLAYRTLNITGKDPDISVPKEMIAKDVRGQKVVIPPDTYTPHKLNTGNVILKDGQQFTITKNQYQNIKNQSQPAEAKEFAPELKETEVEKLLLNIRKDNAPRVSLPDSVSVKKYSSLFLNPMDQLVATNTNNSKVLKSVVSFLPVDVVNKFAENGISPKQFISNPSLFSDKFPVESGLAITKGIKSALAKTGTLIRTGLNSAYKSGLDKEILPTLRASDFDTDVATRITFPHKFGQAMSGSPTGLNVRLGGTTTRTEPGLGVLAGDNKSLATSRADFIKWHKSIVAERRGDVNQFGIRITPAIKAMVKGEKLPIKKPSGAMPELGKKVDITKDPNIIKAKAHAESLGVKVDFEFVDESRYIDYTNPEHRAILKAHGMSEEAINNAERKGEQWGIYGKHLYAGEGGQGRSKIELFRGYTAFDVHHEYTHAIEAQGGLPGWKGTSEQKAHYLEAVFAKGEAGKITELTPGGARVAGKATPEEPRMSIREKGELEKIEDILQKEKRPRVSLPRTTLDHAVNINLNKIQTTADARNLIQELAQEYRPIMDEARQKISWEETKQIAKEIDMTPERLQQAKSGTLDSAELEAARQLFVRLSEETAELSKKAQMTKDETDVAKAAEAVAKQIAIQASWTGHAAEAGRALNILRSITKASGTPAERARQVLKVLGGRELNEEMATRLALIDPKDQVAFNKFLLSIHKATIPSMIYEFWLNNILSAPPTHMANMLGNTLGIGYSIPERAVAVAVDQALSAITGKRTMYAAEIPAKLKGSAIGLVEGVARGLKAFNNGVALDKFDIHYIPAIPEKITIPKKVLGMPIPFGGKSFGKRVGSTIRIPTKFLTAEDEFFKAVVGTGEKFALAARQARSEGLVGKEYDLRVANLVGEPSDTMKKMIQDEETYRTFQNELGEIGKKLMSFREAGGLKNPAKWVIPFLKTPANVSKVALHEYTPLGIFVQMHRAMTGKYKFGKGFNQEQFAKDTAKSVMGTLIFSAITLLVAKGLITGRGPRDKTKKELLYATGWQPRSLKIGGRYLSYARIQPLGMVMSAIADAVEDAQAGNKQSMFGVIGTMASNMADQTFLSGVSDAMNAILDSGRYADKWMERMATGFLPISSMGRVVAQQFDPTIRQPKGLGATIMAQTPGLSRKITPKVDVLGKESKRVGGISALMAVPISKETGNKLAEDLVKLNVDMPSAPKKITFGNRSYILTPEQQNRYLEIRGVEIARRFKTLPLGTDEQKIRRYEMGIRMANDRAKMLMYRELRSAK